MARMRFPRSMLAYARFGWHAGATGREYADISFRFRRRHARAFALGKALGRKLNNL